MVDDPACLDSMDELDDELKIVLMEMLDENSEQRPNLDALLNILNR